MTEDATFEDYSHESADSEGGAKSVGPLRALREHCQWCCNGSAHEVKLCSAVSCPLWAFRLGHRPAAEEKMAVADLRLYPLERSSTGAEFHDKGGTALKAIRRRCLDCTGGSQVVANGCTASDCDSWAHEGARAVLLNRPTHCDRCPTASILYCRKSVFGGARSRTRDLHPFRKGKNPNFKISEERRFRLAASLVATRGKMAAKRD